MATDRQVAMLDALSVAVSDAKAAQAETDAIQAIVDAARNTLAEVTANSQKAWGKAEKLKVALMETLTKQDGTA